LIAAFKSLVQLLKYLTI